jgi:transcriptional regulator with XRE-family HTH domain
MLAGLSGTEMGYHLKVSQKTISRIERGDSLPSLAQVTTWVNAAGFPERLPALRSFLEAAVSEIVIFRERLAGLASSMQIEFRELEATSRAVRNFQPGIIPGLLQTAEYARRILQMAGAQDDDDLAAAVTVRLERQQALYDQERRFEFVMTEAALRWRPGPGLLTAQLDHLASMATLETVELAVIPGDAEMHAITRCGFIVYEDRSDGQPPVVAIETPHSLLYATDADVETYRDQLALFRQSALYGADALDFIRGIARNQ